MYREEQAIANDPEAGYSLLELVTAIALLALLSIPLYAGTRFGVTTWQTSHQTSSELEKLILVRARLKQWLQYSYPHDFNRAVEEKTFPMAGNEQYVEFVGPINPDPRFNQLYKIQVFLNEKNQLIARFNIDPLNLPPVNLNEVSSDLDKDQNYTNHILLNNVSNFSISYMKHPDLTAVYDWQDSWNSNVQLPIALKIKIAVEDNRLSLGDLIIPLNIREWSHCGYDAEKKLCRTGINADCDYDAGLGQCRASLTSKKVLT
jgi:hypothetical protein